MNLYFKIFLEIKKRISCALKQDSQRVNRKIKTNITTYKFKKNFYSIVLRYTISIGLFGPVIVSLEIVEIQ